MHIYILFRNFEYIVLVNIMNILHIAAHLGDGAGKAISGLSVKHSASGKNTHRILLLDMPKKLNHLHRCLEAGIEVLEESRANTAIAWSDIVIINWWGAVVMDKFLKKYPTIPCRVVLWCHKNGFFDPPLSDNLVNTCDALLATLPMSLENPSWRKKGTLVWGFGDFEPETFKNNYNLANGCFTIGYVGTPSYKKLPPDFLRYCFEVINRIPETRFIMAGETTDEFKGEIRREGLERYFDFPGWVNNVNELLISFDVFGYLLRSDSSAATENAIWEAQAAGLPMVVSRYPVGQYFIETGVSGFLTQTPKEYGEIMLRLYESRALREKIGKTARKRAITCFKADENIASFNAVCQRIIKQNKRIRNFGGN
jgi:glycosyltransferase involved in cell wall biosynthesis